MRIETTRKVVSSRCSSGALLAARGEEIRGNARVQLTPPQILALVRKNLLYPALDIEEPKYTQRTTERQDFFAART
jgi:hypothetical protein